jgi:ubiquinone/menaquinone biosynthesis C-methylase UbiE
VKPEQYASYAFVFDAFTRIGNSTGLDALYSEFEAALPEGGSLIEAGGGTGLLTASLLERRPDVRVTFIEPSPKMMVQARSRLKEGPHTLLEMTLDDALPQIAPHNAALFSRVLYALYGDFDSFLEFFERVRDKIVEGGVVGIFELTQKYDIAAQKEWYSRAGEAPFSSPPLFRKLWPIMERVLMDFNDGVDAGEFHLFSLHELETLLDRTGFETSISKTISDNHVLVARKRT